MNCELLSIDKRTVKGYIGHVQVILPALNVQWITEKQFLFYTFPPNRLPYENYAPGAKETWLESTSSVVDDIWWLCELKYHEFWSQVIFDSGAVNGLRSFLQLAPLQEVYFEEEDTEIMHMYKKIKKATLQLVKRIFRLKESELQFMSEEKYGEILTTKQIPPTSWLFSLACLYGHSDQEIVQNVISHAFKYNSNLCLENVVIRTIQLFSSLKKKLQEAYRNLKVDLNNANNVRDVVEFANSYRQSLYSCVQFLANAIRNISRFLSVYKIGHSSFLNHDFDFHIIRVYKKIISVVSSEMAMIFNNERLRKRFSNLELLLCHAREDFIFAFYECLKTLMDNFDVPANARNAVNRYTQLLKHATGSLEFLIDLNHFKKFNEFHELFRNSCPRNIDLTEFDEAYEAQLKTLSEFRKNNHDGVLKEKRLLPDGGFFYDFLIENENMNSVEKLNERIDDDGSLSDELSSDYNDWSDNHAEFEGNSENDSRPKLTEGSGHESLKGKIGRISSLENPTPSTSVINISEVDLQTAISQVKDLLPHLGCGFIASCLNFYKMDVPALINAVLENKLPYHLQEVDFSLSAVPLHILENLKSELNVVNNPHSITEPGLKALKKLEYASYSEMLNDREDLSKVKGIYEKYRNVDDSYYNDDVEDDYEDDYMHVVEADSEGFFTEYVQLPKENPNRAIHESSIESESDDQELETIQYEANKCNKDQYKKPLNFCENPEMTRARIEHRYQTNKEKRYRGHEFYNRCIAPEDTENNARNNNHRARQVKTTNKTRTGNHNRRFFSDRKRKQ